MYVLFHLVSPHFTSHNSVFSWFKSTLTVGFLGEWFTLCFLRVLWLLTYGTCRHASSLWLFPRDYSSRGTGLGVRGAGYLFLLTLTWVLGRTLLALRVGLFEATWVSCPVRFGIFYLILVNYLPNFWSLALGRLARCPRDLVWAHPLPWLFHTLHNFPVPGGISFPIQSSGGFFLVLSFAYNPRSPSQRFSLIYGLAGLLGVTSLVFSFLRLGKFL